jgi:septum formation inhibitor MinC
MANNLYNAIRIVHRSPTAILALLVDSYTADYRTFATGNNRGPLEEAVKILTGSKLDKALGLAISKGYEAGDLTIGYIGSVTGKYANQPSETHAKYDGAIERATSAFRVALTDSGLFAEKTEATKEEKEKAKSEREEKKAKEAAEQKAAILHAAVISGEVVRAADIVPAPDIHEMASIVCNSIIAGLLTDGELEMLRVALSIVAAVAPVADTVSDTVTA